MSVQTTTSLSLNGNARRVELDGLPTAARVVLAGRQRRLHDVLAAALATFVSRGLPWGCYPVTSRGATVRSVPYHFSESSTIVPSSCISSMISESLSTRLVGSSSELLSTATDSGS